MTNVAVLVVTDGRDDYLARCLESVGQRLSGPVVEWYLFDDTGDDRYRADLAVRYPGFRHIHGGRRQGFGGAIRAAWEILAAESEADWVCHVEGDFVFNRAVDLADLVAVLQPRPYLLQMALRRQAWNAAEHAAGGVVEQHPEAYEPHRDAQGRAWLEHRLFLTTNPSVYRRSMCDLVWPLGARSEGRFTATLLDCGTVDVPAADVRFGYWGARTDPPWVEHIGLQRIGGGY